MECLWNVCTLLICILSTSFTSVSIFSVCCYSRYLSLWDQAALSLYSPKGPGFSESCVLQVHQTQCCHAGGFSLQAVAFFSANIIDKGIFGMGQSQEMDNFTLQLYRFSTVCVWGRWLLILWQLFDTLHNKYDIVIGILSIWITTNLEKAYSNAQKSSKRKTTILQDRIDS